MTTESDGQAVARLAEERLGRPETWKDKSDYGYPDSLALCVIDSAFSLRVRYGSVKAVIRKYRGTRAADGADANLDGTPELIAAIDRHGGPALFANESCAPGTKVRKYDVVFSVAQRLNEDGVRTSGDLRIRLENEDQADKVRKLWLGVKGLGQASWHYLVMLAGGDDSKPDIWIKRFVADAIGRSVSELDTERARTAVIDAAARLKVTTVALDHAIWLAKRR